MFGSKTYEILTLRGGTWSIEATAKSRDSAQAEATRLLNQPKVEGVRVINETDATIDNLSPTDILFEKLKPKTADRIFLQPILDAPMCEDADELFDRPARMTINRLFRSYLDKHNITATELMNAPREMKRLLDEGTLISSAAAKVGGLQARKLEGSTANERRDVLFKWVDQLYARARAASEKKWPRIREVGFNGLIQHVVTVSADGDFGYLARFALSAELVDNRSYFGKLSQLLIWAKEAEHEWIIPILDGFISDVLWNTDVLRDMLGSPRDLGSALVTMICFAVGETKEEEVPEDIGPDHPKFFTVELGRLISAGLLPDSQEVLYDRVRRQLEGLNPLSRGDREEEREVFLGLLDKLIPDLNVLGGGEMAEAVTARQSTIINKGGQKGMKEAAASMLPSLRDPCRKTGYLLALLECGLGQEALRPDIEELLDKVLVQPPSVNHIFLEKLAPNLKMQKMTSIYYRINESSLPDERKQVLTERLDELLAAYIVNSKILDKVNHPERPLHIRAMMLVSMVQPEMLPRGKASALARDIIVNHLKRPNFEADLVAQIPDPAEKAKTLRRFHEQLRRSGFFG